VRKIKYLEYEKIVLLGLRHIFAQLKKKNKFMILKKQENLNNISKVWRKLKILSKKIALIMARSMLSKK